VRHEVRGEGVLGEQPVLEPAHSIMFRDALCDADGSMQAAIS
jgi:uncharacterized protein affecting Mg2+/Co2+ transport